MPTVELGKRAIAAINRPLRAVGVEVRPSASHRTWDRDFRQWIRDAEASGGDPNDIGDQEWATDLLVVGLREVYGPLLEGASRVLELGPGSGRLTRHLVDGTREVIVADRSAAVCEWLERYLRGEGPHQIIRIRSAAVPQVEPQPVDVVLAHGVFEHLELDAAYWFTLPGPQARRERHSTSTPRRRPPASSSWRRQATPRSTPGSGSHAPEAVGAIAKAAGLSTPTFRLADARIPFATCQKSGS
jgi:hypothetical protein